MVHRWAKKKLAATKKNFGFDPEKSFVVADEVLDFYRKAGARGAEMEKKWNELFAVV